MKRDIKTIVLHYLVAALWTNEEQEEGLQGLSAVCDVDEAPTNNANLNTKEMATLQVECFLGAALPLLTEEWTDEQIGHDLWLTRGGHGAGFWDRNLPNGDKLTEICKLIPFNGQVFEKDGKMFIEESDDSNLDLLKNYELLPQDVQDVLMNEGDMDDTYENCDKLLEILKPLGYTFDYYLNAEPYHLRVIG